MSDSDDEDYAFYGTPLEPIDEDNIPRKKAFSVEDQIATDKQGRRRFHGAFTGGFSAGFFNTVGSLEGWKPSSFKSSRTSKAESHTQNPEDFMDDEDRDEFGIAPTVLRARPEYGGGERGQKRGKPVLQEGPIPGEPVLQTILEPVKETVGIKLLMKMGWKPGQGVGPRMTKFEKRRMRRKEKGGETDEDSDVDETEGVTFAPDELKPPGMEPKINRKGMGYKGLKNDLQRFCLFEDQTLRLCDEKNRKLSIRGQAFGVGAFEDEDEDIYAKDDLSQYDFALESKGSRKKKEKESRQLALTDQSGIIEGFVPTRKNTVVRKYFEPPELPVGYKPSARQSRFSASSTTARVERNTTKLTAQDRSVIIGEQNENKSEEASKLIEGVKNVESSFRPFENDPDKQERYEKYLKFIKIGAKDAFTMVQPKTMTEWEREKERSEFEKAAKLYKPLSGVMADRFTSAVMKDGEHEMDDPVEGKGQAAEAAKMKMFGTLTREVLDWEPHSLIYKRFNIAFPKGSSGDLAKAANEKNRGKLKFSVFDFLEASKKNSLSSLQCSSEVKTENLEEEDVAKEIEEPERKEESTEPSEVETGIPQSTQNDIEFEEPPNKMDLFKAIFLSSSEDEEDISDSRKKENNSIEVKKQEDRGREARVEEKVVNVLRNTSPPRGIFANLDLDALAVKRDVTPKPKEKETEKEQKDEEETGDVDELAYGPRLPDKKVQEDLKSKTMPRASSDHDSDSSDEWVEKPTVGRTKEEKSSSHKKKKKKHKKNKKKKKGH